MNFRRFTHDLMRVDGPRISGLVPSRERSLRCNGRKQTWTGHNSPHTRRLATPGNRTSWSVTGGWSFITLSRRLFQPSCPPRDIHDAVKLLCPLSVSRSAANRPAQVRK